MILHSRQAALFLVLITDQKRLTCLIFTYQHLTRPDAHTLTEFPLSFPLLLTTLTLRELQNFREGEIKEMIDIYVERGMEADDAEVRYYSSEGISRGNGRGLCVLCLFPPLFCVLGVSA